MKLRNLRMSQLQGTVDQGSAWTPVLSPFFFLSVYRFSHYQGNTMHTFVDALKKLIFFFFFFFYCRATHFIAEILENSKNTKKKIAIT